MKKLVTPLLLLTGLHTATAQVSYQPPVFTDENRAQKVSALIPAVEKIYKEYAEKNHLPGMAWGIVVDGKLVASSGYGYTDVAKKVAATPKSLFRIASMSKSITAMGILKLREEGKLKLDDPVALYIPELKKSPALTKDAPSITIRHLLTHAAGFPEDNPWGDRQLADTEQELLDLLSTGIAYSNAPGLTFEYSNLGFAMLGRIISVVSGKPYQQYLNERIFKPLSMENTVWEYEKAPAPLLAHGYRYENDAWSEEALLHDGIYGAMGGVITSVEDFARYVAVHLDAWPPRDDRETGPVPRHAVREMHHPWNFTGMFNRPKKDGTPCMAASAYAYGLAWNRYCDGKISIAHSGGLPGFGSNWRILPEYGVGIISCANLTYANMGYVNSLALDTLLTILTPRKLPVSSVLEQRKQALIPLLTNWSGAEKSELFAENFFADQSVALREKHCREVFARVGKITRITELTPENQLRGAFRMEGEKGTVQVFFTLTPEHRPLIQQLDVWEVRR